MTKPLTWKLRNGTKVPISELDDVQLASAIAWARRTHRERVLELALSADRYSQTAPDGAFDDVEQTIRVLAEFGLDLEALFTAATEVALWGYQLADDPTDWAVAEGLPAFEHLLREARRRQLPIGPGALA